MERRDFLLGSLTGLVVGTGLQALLGYRLDQQIGESQALLDQLSQAQAGGAEAGAAATAAPDLSQYGTLSFAQHGEDLVVENIFRKYLGIEKPTFIDIGAHDPIIANNTFRLYLLGGRGVLVEPNPFFCELLRKARPEDTTLQIGVGVDDVTEADYYIIKGGGQNNTFDAEQVERYKAEGGEDVVEDVLKMPLVNINKVLAEHFAGAAPDFFSIDVEGLDLAILQTLDFDHHRPKVLCVETMTWGTTERDPEVLDFLAAKDYEVRGGSFVNTVLVDRRLL